MNVDDAGRLKHRSLHAFLINPLSTDARDDPVPMLASPATD
jgi:hypothetical protein